jgi:hypothetical protein
MGPVWELTPEGGGECRKGEGGECGGNMCSCMKMENETVETLIRRSGE